MLLFLMTAALEVLGTTLKYSRWEEKHFAASDRETKTATENTRQSKTKPSRIIFVTMLIELDLLKCLWILLDEVSHAQVNVSD